MLLARCFDRQFEVINNGDIEAITATVCFDSD